MKIELKHLHKVYKTKKNITEVLRDINLSICEGEEIIIVGESGAGKSTLLNLIGMIDSEYSGDYYVDGREKRQLTKKEISQYHNSAFGYIFQEYALVEDETVYKNVVIPLLYSNVKKREHRDRVKKILEQVELSREIDKKVKELSGGQRQRVAIARALVNNPSILLADEPTGSLNNRLSEQIMTIMENYLDETKILIMVTHNLDMIDPKRHRVLRLKDGVLKEDIKEMRDEIECKEV